MWRSVVRVLLLFFISSFAKIGYAQEIQASAFTQSKLSVTVDSSKTNLVVTGFPAKTSIVIFDDQNNLLSVISTNVSGSACVMLPSPSKQTFYAKTLNGEIIVSGKTGNEATRTKELLAVNTPISKSHKLICYIP